MERVCVKRPSVMVRIWLPQMLLGDDEVDSSSGVDQFEEVEADKTADGPGNSVEINMTEKKLSRLG